jgi:hypothetical protein
MGRANSYQDLLRYKLRHVGIWNTLQVAYMDLSEEFLYRLSRRFPSITISPRSIQIESTTRCNLKCTFCELSYWTEKPADLEFENIQKMADHLPKVRRVDLTGIGESLMNRDFFRILEFLKARGTYVTLNDNFTLMTEKAARRVVELGVDQIFLSLDGATKETYEKIRVGANFDKVLQNARGLIRIKQEMRKWRPEVKINTVVCMTNYQELPQIVELANEMGIGMVQFVNVMTFESTTALQTQRVMREVREKLEAARERGRQLDVVVKAELFEKLPVEQCDFPWKRNFVTQNGYVHPCCHTTQTGDRAAQNSRSFGNLLESSFQQLWNKSEYSVLRQKLQQGILPTQCQYCPKYVGRSDAPLETVRTMDSELLSISVANNGAQARSSLKPKVGIVILNYNGKLLAERCLNSVAGSQYPNKDVILVDNASTDGSAEYLRARFPDVHILEVPKNLGVVGGRNRGLREAIARGCDYALSLDNDVHIEPNLVQELVSVAETNPGIGIVGPKTYWDDGSRRIQCAGGKITYTQNVSSERGSGETDRGQYDKIEDVDYFPGCGFMARREVLEKLGFLDERFSLLAHEDTDFCMRAVRQGYRIVYAPKAVMWHRGSATHGGYSANRKYWEGVNSVYFVRRHGMLNDRFKYAFFAGFGLIYALVAQSFHGNQKAVFAKARGIWDGLHKPLA